MRHRCYFLFRTGREPGLRLDCSETSDGSAIYDQERDEKLSILWEKTSCIQMFWYSVKVDDWILLKEIKVDFRNLQSKKERIFESEEEGYSIKILYAPLDTKCVDNYDLTLLKNHDMVQLKYLKMSLN